MKVSSTLNVQGHLSKSDNWFGFFEIFDLGKGKVRIGTEILSVPYIQPEIWKVIIVYIHIYIYTYIYVYVYIYIYIYIYIYMYMYIYIYIYIYNIYIYIYIYIYIFMTLILKVNRQNHVMYFSFS